MDNTSSSVFQLYILMFSPKKKTIIIPVLSFEPWRLEKPWFSKVVYRLKFEIFHRFFVTESSCYFNWRGPSKFLFEVFFQHDSGRKGFWTAQKNSCISRWNWGYNGMQHFSNSIRYEIKSHHFFSRLMLWRFYLCSKHIKKPPSYQGGFVFYIGQIILLVC